MSSSRLGEKLPPLDLRRPTWAWYVAGKSRHSISTVVFVEGISTPKCRVISVGFLDEDERRALHDGGARADERDVDVLDLTLPGASRRLQRALDDVPETVDASGAQAPAEGVQRQLTVQLDASALDEIERLARLAPGCRNRRDRTGTRPSGNSGNPLA